MTFQKCSSLKMLCSTVIVLCLATFSFQVRAAPAYDPSKLSYRSSPKPSSRAFFDDSTNSVVLNNEAASASASHHLCDNDGGDSFTRTTTPATVLEHRGGGLIPAGYHPMGYKITALGERFLEFGPTCLESDVGRLLASIKKRKTLSAIQTQWLEIVRVSKSGQSMRIYRTLKDLIDFCLAARLLD